MIDRVAARLGRRLYEVPVGFKWFVDGLLDGSLGFGGEESAGASFLRRDGTRLDDRQGRHRAGAAGGRDHRAHAAAIPASCTRADAASSATRSSDRVEAPATREQKKQLVAALAASRSRSDRAGRRADRAACSTRAPGNGAPIGGIKVIAENGWFAARPSGTEDIYKIYAESFRGAEHLQRILSEAQASSTRRSRPADVHRGALHGGQQRFRPEPATPKSLLREWHVDSMDAFVGDDVDRSRRRRGHRGHENRALAVAAILDEERRHQRILDFGQYHREGLLVRAPSHLLRARGSNA